MKIHFPSVPGASPPPPPVRLAAAELERYLTRMLGDTDALELTLSWCGDGEEDGYDVELGPRGGLIRGQNPRSVLLGAYAALHAAGCRFLGPGPTLEAVPSREALPTLRLSKRASFPCRGVCIEGADSLENILAFVDWLPKVGFNSFFLQFKSPYAFLKRWYSHEGNPLLPAQPFTPEDARRAMEAVEAAVKERGLLLHKVGHGWTGQVLGYDALDWYADPRPLEEDKRPLCAQVNGVRELWKGIPADTNLCLSNPSARACFVDNVVAYARSNPDADCLHIWLADEYNNVCDCGECRQTTLSDQYVALLNEIDARLTREGLSTRLVFLLYQELLWPPIRERLQNPGRFLLMFAPISRTFTRSYDLSEPRPPLPPYRRNRIELPTGLGENLAFLRAWQEQFPGEGFVYDYPLGRAHYGDLGYVHIARVVYDDVHALPQLALNGYMSCQELRVCLPNALPNYVMGRALFDLSLSWEELEEEYFAAAYGPLAPAARELLEALSRLSDCDYFNGKGPRENPGLALRYREIQTLCRQFREARFPSSPREDAPPLPLELLRYHCDYACLLARALEALALGDAQGCREAYRDFQTLIRTREEAYQPYLDVYRVQEVAGKYTGLPADPQPAGAS